MYNKRLKCINKIYVHLTNLLLIRKFIKQIKTYPVMIIFVIALLVVLFFGEKLVQTS